MSHLEVCNNRTTYTVSQKTCSFILRHNFGNCWPILKIPSLLDFAINLQQDISYISHRTLSMSLHYLAKLLLGTRSTFSKLLMMIVGVSKFGKTNLIFVDPGIKTNGTYTFTYCWLSSYCLSCVRSLAISLSSSKTVHCSDTPSSRNNHPCEMGDSCFHFTRPVAPNSPVSAQISTEFGEKCNTGSTRRKFMMMKWSSARRVA